MSSDDEYEIYITNVNDVYEILNYILPKDLSRIVASYYNDKFKECVSCKKLRYYINDDSKCRSCISYKSCENNDMTFGVAFFGFKIDPVSLRLFLEEHMNRNDVCFG